MTSLSRFLKECIILSILCLQAAASEATHHHRDGQFSRLAEWIQSHDGFIDDRITVRTIATGNSSSSYRGVFTNADIRKGEYICFIPWSTIIGAGRWQDEEQGIYDGNFADTVFHVLHELSLGEASEYAPYMDYIRSQSITVPSAWSLPGREFLSTMLGDYLPPRHLERNVEWFARQYGMGSKVMKASYAVSTRAMQANVGSQWLLIPFVDLQNHHSDQDKVNTVRFAKSGKGFEIQATKDIVAGSELYTQYWGTWTHYFFEEFGFIEAYPQRWRFAFPIDDDGESERIVDVRLVPSQSNDNNTTPINNMDNQTMFDLEWFSEFPDAAFIGRLQSELTRLETFQRDFDDTVKHLGSGVPTEELNLTWEYYGVLVTAIKEVIAAFDASEQRQLQEQQPQEEGDCAATHATATTTTLNHHSSALT